MPRSSSLVSVRFAATAEKPKAPIQVSVFSGVGQGNKLLPANVPPPLDIVTAPLAYVRFHGRNRDTWEAPGITAAELQRLNTSHTDSFEAYESYLKGRYAWNRREPETVGRAVEFFNDAIAADPDFAPAHAGLADCYVVLGGAPYGVMPPADATRLATAAAETAIRADPSLAEAHATLALLAWSCNLDWRMAEEEFARSFELNPAYATAHQWHAEYLAANPAVDSSGVRIEMEAEFPSYKNDTSIRPVNSRSLEVTPYDTYKLLLNSMGGDSWDRSGSAVYYEFDAPQDGYYCITLRALQNYKNNFTVFRRITIDEQILFEELNDISYFSSNRWANMPIGGDTPYKIYLTQGTHILGIEANDAPYHSAIEKIKKVLIDINVLSLDIKKLTGNQVDPYKEWVISDYIPDIKDQLLAIAADLQVDLGGLKAINKEGGSQEILSYQMAIDNILFLAEDPDKIPSRMNRFSEGSGSAAQLLGNVLPLLQGQPLALDKIYIHSPDSIPEQVKVPVITSLIDGTKRFIYSFRPNPYLGISLMEWPGQHDSLCHPGLVGFSKLFRRSFSNQHCAYGWERRQNNR